MRQQRFSKATLAAYLQKRINSIQSSRHFDAGNGWAQINGKGEAINRDYGEFVALLDVANGFGLDIFAE